MICNVSQGGTKITELGPQIVPACKHGIVKGSDAMHIGLNRFQTVPLVKHHYNSTCNRLSNSIHDQDMNGPRMAGYTQ